MFSEWGLAVRGSDRDPEMVRVARRNARDAGDRKVKFRVCDYLDAQKAYGEKFDAVVCIGNSLAAAADRRTVRLALGRFVRMARPGGLVIVHVLNFYRFIDCGERFQSPKVVRGDGRTSVYIKFFDVEGPRVQLNLVEVSWDGPKVEQRVGGGSLLPLYKEDFVRALGGMKRVKARVYGDYGFRGFRKRSSLDLIVVGRVSG